MDDIFDKAAASSGDIFDQAAAAQPQIPDATAQAHAMFQPGGKLYPGKLPPERTYDYGAALGGLPSPGRTVSGEEGQQIHEQAKSGLKTGIEMGGGMLGGAAVEGPGVIASLLRMAGAGAGAATGNVVGSAATGQTPNPNEALKTGGIYAAGEGVGQALGATVPPLVKWLGASKTVGAKLLQQASVKAGTAPVEMSAKTNEIVEEIVKQGKLGGTVPKVITDLLDRVGPTVRHAAEADAGPLTYDEARILQSNAGQMSAQEQMTLKGKLKYLIPQFAKSFGRDVQAAADQAGVGAEHAAGMKEFANASARNRTLSDAAKYVGIPSAAIAAEEGLRHLWKK